MQDSATAGCRTAASPEVRLDARITPAVDRRLRMLALIKRQPVSRVLSGLLDSALPQADELAAALLAADPACGEAVPA